MCEEKKELTKEDPSTSLQPSLPAMARHSRAGKIEKAKQLMLEVKELKLTSEEMDAVVGGYFKTKSINSGLIR
jgi:hypothetical protein